MVIQPDPAVRKNKKIVDDSENPMLHLAKAFNRTAEFMVEEGFKHGFGESYLLLSKCWAELGAEDTRNSISLVGQVLKPLAQVCLLYWL